MERLEKARTFAETIIVNNSYLKDGIVELITAMSLYSVEQKREYTDVKKKKKINMINVTNNTAIAFHNAKVFVNAMLLVKPEYKKQRDSMILLLQSMYLYIAEKGHDINDERALYDIFSGCNLTVLKYKFGTLEGKSEAVALFYFYRSGLPDSVVNEDIDALADLLKYYFENNIDIKR